MKLPARTKQYLLLMINHPGLDTYLAVPGTLQCWPNSANLKGAMDSMEKLGDPSASVGTLANYSGTLDKAIGR